MRLTQLAQLVNFLGFLFGGRSAPVVSSLPLARAPVSSLFARGSDADRMPSSCVLLPPSPPPCLRDRYPTLSSRITGLQLYPAGERAFGPPSAAEGSFPWMHRDILWDAVGVRTGRCTSLGHTQCPSMLSVCLT